MSPSFKKIAFVTKIDKLYKRNYPAKPQISDKTRRKSMNFSMMKLYLKLQC